MKATAWIILLTIIVAGCSTFQDAGLYQQAAQPDNKPNINGFYQVAIFRDVYSGDVWFSKKPECVQVAFETKEVKTGDGALSIKWDKQAADCGWIGMGFGWDNWTGKDLSLITHTAAISFWAKTKKGSSKGLPWAVGFEDFSGNQAWSGVTADCVKGGVIGNTWTEVIIPLDRFSLDDADIDPTTIKQLLFQFESSGSIWMDEITIVPFTPVGPKKMLMEQSSGIVTDGKIASAEWPDSSFNLDCGIIKVTADQNYLYVGGRIKDNSPFINNQKGKDIWNGDAVEIAFSTNAGADPKRKIYYNTDKHIGIQLGGSFEVYEWQAGMQLTGVEIKRSISNDSVYFEAKIPWSSLAVRPWEKGNQYGIEVAVDLGSADGAREYQYRWNTPGREGFNMDPSLWGILKIN
ncbi:MAG: hypothetical protein IPG01_12630 [Chitinophagaceae bacterium]|nr:hypothetical protein [Chitinophagaceae bacterium]